MVAPENGYHTRQESRATATSTTTRPNPHPYARPFRPPPRSDVANVTHTPSIASRSRQDYLPPRRVGRRSAQGHTVSNARPMRQPSPPPRPVFIQFVERDVLERSERQYQENLPNIMRAAQLEREQRRAERMWHEAQWRGEIERQRQAAASRARRGFIFDPELAEKQRLQFADLAVFFLDLAVKGIHGLVPMARSSGWSPLQGPAVYYPPGYGNYIPVPAGCAGSHIATPAPVPALARASTPAPAPAASAAIVHVSPNHIPLPDSPATSASPSVPASSRSSVSVNPIPAHQHGRTTSPLDLSNLRPILSAPSSARSSASPSSATASWVSQQWALSDSAGSSPPTSDPASPPIVGRWLTPAEEPPVPSASARPQVSVPLAWTAPTPAHAPPIQLPFVRFSPNLAFPQAFMDKVGDLMEEGYHFAQQFMSTPECQSDDAEMAEVEEVLMPEPDVGMPSAH